jgi:tRNA (Thr-GGU) A37 N-methylase
MGTTILANIPMPEVQAHELSFNMSYLYFDNTQSYISQVNKTQVNKTQVNFSTRSPERPNPIALSVTQVTHIDYEKGMIYIDVMNASFLLY